jgi:FKBP-type peptidyl-prolyl cis-trans isomerase SlyD
MQIANKKAVAIDYSLSIDDGIIVDASEKGAPLWYLHGVGNLVPGLEKELSGMSLGDKKTVVVSAEEGYGERQTDRVHEVPKDRFPPGTAFSIGDQVMARSPAGEEVPARVAGMTAKQVTVDFNHELAGKILTFEIRIAEIRKATKEEIEHGHVHGPGGHQH